MRFVMYSFVLLAWVLAACGDDGNSTPVDGMPAADAPPANLGVDLAPDLAPILESSGMPALGAIAANETEILGTGVVGVRKVNTVKDATVLDNWHLGSDTKAMTATLIALAVDAGELSWDATLPELFPGVTIHAGYQSVTLPMLLAHMGGLPANPPDDIWAAMSQPGASRTRRMDAVTAMLARAPGGPVGTFEYSNAGYMVAGAALERAADAAWEDLMRIRLFTPLGMTDCQFGPTAAGSQIDQPWGHHTVNGTLTPNNGDNPPALGPAGTANCPLAQWVAFLQEHLRGANGQTTTLAISAATWTTLHTPPNSGGTYAFGWGISGGAWTNGQAFTHVGSNTLNMANVWFAPGAHRIYAAVVNSGDDAAYDATDAAINKMAATFAP